METWEMVFICATIGLVVMTAIANALYVLWLGDDGIPKQSQGKPSCPKPLRRGNST